MTFRVQNFNNQWICEQTFKGFISNNAIGIEQLCRKLRGHDSAIILNYSKCLKELLNCFSTDRKYLQKIRCKRSKHAGVHKTNLLLRANRVIKCIRYRIPQTFVKRTNIQIIVNCFLKGNYVNKLQKIAIKTSNNFRLLDILFNIYVIVNNVDFKNGRIQATL